MQIKISAMKILLNLLLFSLFTVFYVSAQEVPSAPVPSNVPSADELRKMGASETQIKQAMDIIDASKNQKGGRVGNTQSTGINTPLNEVKDKGKDPVTSEKKDAKSEEKKDEKKEVDKKEGDEDLERKLKHDIDESSVYGKDIFINGNIKFFEKATEVIAPEKYRLGPKDQIGVNIWGFSDYSDTYIINDQGYISSKYTGRIPLKGLTFVNAKALLRSRLGQAFDLDNSQIDINLTYSRVITVNFVGEVKNPGSYTIPAVNTAFNALVAASGPNKIGSVRNIFVKREGKIIDTLDVYKFLLDPSSYQDLFMQNNDYIFIPPSKRNITIRGEVKRPTIYELRDNENLFTLLKYSGGLNATAYKSNIQVKRIRNNSEILLDINLDSLQKNKKDFILFDQDEVLINRIPRGVVNMVSLTGAVKLPGDYELKKGDKISDLIKKAEGLLKDASFEKGFVIRLKENFTKDFIPVNFKNILKDTASPDNIVLHEFDVVNVLSQSAFAESFKVSITGEVNAPDLYNLGSGLTIRDGLALVGGVTPDAYLERAYLIREGKDFSKKYIPINIGNILKDPGSPDNYTLQKFDQIKVLSKREFNDEFFIYVYGSVKKPDRFLFGQGISLNDVLLLSGGLLPEAANNNIEVTRVVEFEKSSGKINSIPKSTTTFKVNKDLSLEGASELFLLMPYDQIYVRTNPDYELQENIVLNGEVMFPGKYSLMSKNEKISDIIARAGGLTKYAFKEATYIIRPQIGNIPINLNKALNSPKSNYNAIVSGGDEIYIPQVIDLVRISGQVANTKDNIINSPFFGKRAGFYVKEFGGGFAEDASKRNVYAIYPNGQFKRTKNIFGFIHLYPKIVKNSAIFVPVNKDKHQEKSKPSDPIDYNALIEKTAIKITGIITLLLLLRSIGK